MKRILALILASLLMFTVACAETATEGDHVLLAVVNGNEIYTDSYNFQYVLNYFESQYGELEGDDLSYVKGIALNNAVEMAILSQKAEEMGISQVTDAQKSEYKAQALVSWEEMIAYYENMYFGIDDNSSDEDKANARAMILSALEAQGATQDAYVNEYVEGCIQNAPYEAVSAELTKDISITDEMIVDAFNAAVEEDKSMYDGNVFMYEFSTHYYGQSSYFIPEGYRGVLNILLSVDEELLNTYNTLTATYEEQQEAETADETTEETTEASAEETAAPAEPVTPEQIEAARQAILDSVQPAVDEIMGKIQNGVPFQDLIAEYNTDPGMTDPETLANGYMVHADSIVWDPAFTESAMSLEKVSDVSTPVVSSFGVHILYYLRDVPAGAVEMTDEIKSALADSLISDLKNDRINTALSGWKAETDITYTAEGQAILDTLNSLSAAETADDSE